MAKKSFWLTTLIVMFSICLLFTGCSIGSKKDKGTTPVGMHCKIDDERTDFVFRMGDEFTTSIAYVVDSEDNRVDGYTIVTNVYNPEGSIIETKTEDKITFRMMRTGIFKVEYAVPDDKNVEPLVFELNVCEQLSMPDGFVYNNGTLTWDEVENAKAGYAISVNGGAEQKISTASYTSDELGDGFFVKVRAIGDRVKFIDSEDSVYQQRIPLKDGELAAFNDPNYTLDISLGEPKDTNVLPTATYVKEEDCEGSHGGALKLGIVSGTYGHTIFKITLPRVFTYAELPVGGVLEIRFKLDSHAYQVPNGISNQQTSFHFLKPYSAENCGVLNLYEETNDQWQVFKANITDSGFERNYGTLNEIVHLQMQVYNLQRSGGKGDLYLDYVRYCESTLDTPTNLVLDNDVLTWDAVTDASSYTVEMTRENGETNETIVLSSKTNSIDLTAYTGKRYDVKVRAVSDEDPTKASSDFTDYVSNYKPLTAPVNVQLNDTTLSWDAVENASKYIVAINGVESEATTNSLDVSASLTSDCYFKVKAISDSYKFSPSGYSDAVISISTPTGKKIADFNSVAYEGVVAPSTHRPKFTKLMGVEYAKAVEGEHDGAVSIKLQKLVNNATGNYRLAYFFLNLPRTITQTDFETYDGIKIRFKPVSTTDGDGDLQFKLAVFNDTFDGYINGSLAISEVTTATGWTTFYVDKATLSAIGLTGDISTLKLYLYKCNPCYGDGTLQIDPITTILLDDVSFYGKLEAPKNVKVQGTTLSWDAVQGASEYVVYVNGDEFTTTATSYDVTAYVGSDYIFKVMAKSSEGEGENSVYSDSVAYVSAPTGNTIANFNHIAYESIGAGTTVKPTWSNYLGAEFVEAVEGVHDGAVSYKVQKLVNGTGNYRYYYFNLNLPRTITQSDLAGYDGFVIRYQITSTQEVDYKYRFGVVSSSKADNSTPAKLETEDQLWHELYVTKADLTTLGLTGDISSLTLMLNQYSSLCSNADYYTIVTIDDISYYKSLSVPTNVKVQDTTLTWDAVTNADGYIVYVNGDEVSATTNSLDVTAYVGSDYIFMVKAVADSFKFSPSEYSDSVAYVAPTTGSNIANFNTAAYESVVAPSTYKATFTKLMGAQFVEAVEGEHDGAVAITLQKLVNGGTGNYRLAYFFLNLPRTITQTDFETYAGISIRFKMVESTDGDLKFKLAVSNDNFDGYIQGSPAISDETSGNEWHTLYVDKATLNSIGLTGDITSLRFYLRKSDPCYGDGASSVDPITTLLIDDISFYKPLDVPTNVEINDTTLTWDAVEGASEYVVYVNGTETTVTTTTFDLTSYLSADYIAKVKAISSEGEGLNSVYSEAVAYVAAPTGNSIATFNTPAYESLPALTTLKPTWCNYLGSEFVADGGESDGALAVTLQKLVNDNTQNYRQSYVNIALPRTITASDLATYDGIQIRLKVLTTTDGEGKDKKFHFGVNTGSFYAGGDSAVRVMNADLSDYVTLQCSTADLAKIGLTDNISTLQILFQKADPYCSGHGALSVDPITTFLIDDISFYVAE